MKSCTKCNIIKTSSEFSKKSATVDGLRPNCKECDNVYYEAIKETRSLYNKAYYQTHKIERANINRKTLLRSNYGLTVDNYDQMLASQNNLCKICGKCDLDLPLAVDHDHLTNKVRGLLCRSCNIGLGNFKDSVLILLSAIEYLRKS